MATKQLYDISFNWDAKADEENLKKLQKWEPKARFKKLDEFGVYPWEKKEEKYSSWTDEMFDAFQKEEFDKYMAEPVREITVAGILSADLDLFLADEIDVEFKVKPGKVIQYAVASADVTEVFEAISRLSHQLERRESLNGKCQVHIAGSHLLTINRLMLMEDACTDAVQDYLNKGWRIVSCNVQDARRPDYVLGKYDPGFEGDSNSAERG